MEVANQRGRFDMAKKLAIVLTAILLVLAAWVLLAQSDSFSIVVNGRPVAGPLGGGIGAAGLIGALIAGLCAATILLFVLAGIGIVILGCFVLVGTILALSAFPFLLPLLLPLTIVWLFIAISRTSGSSR